MMLIIYAVSIVLMLFYYYLDSDHPKYREMNYSEFLLCFLFTICPVVNTVCAFAIPIYYVTQLDFWGKKPFKKDA